MIELEQRLHLTNYDWLMSSREKLVLVGLLKCLKPGKILELGYHRGGATNG